MAGTGLLKIDRFFVAGSATPQGLEMLGALVQIGRALEVATVADGVETEEQRRIISYLGATCLQGFLVGRPVPLALVGVSQEPAPDASVA